MEEKKTMKFEIHDIHLINALGHFAHHLSKEKTNMLRIDLGETISDDNHNIRVGVGTQPVSFTFEGNDFKFCRNRFSTIPVPSHMHTSESFIPEEVILEAETIEAAKSLCHNALEYNDLMTKATEKYRIFTWDAQGDHWRRSYYVSCRDWESVVLDESLSEKLCNDVEEFVSQDVKDWYKRHGMPYRRGYLFYGPPGTGKTSMISALASKLQRNIYRVNIATPRLTDESLQCAISSVRPGSIIVMEDLDCLFNHMRDKTEMFSVTFSGLLNAIDGLCDAKGALFIFTSNHPDRLDPALCRKGRIDVEFKFGYATKSQAENMFLRFYPNFKEEAKSFASNIKPNTMSTATLQEHFILCKKKEAKDAVEMQVAEKKFGANLEMWS